MSAFADTSILVRYLTGNPPGQLDCARRIVDETVPLLIPPVVLAETAYVLLSVYDIPRAVALDALIDLVRKRNIIVHGLDKDLAAAALRLCRPSGRVSPTDALQWALARQETASDPGTVVYTFDKRFPDDGIDVRSTPQAAS